MFICVILIQHYFLQLDNNDFSSAQLPQGTELQKIVVLNNKRIEGTLNQLCAIKSEKDKPHSYLVPNDKS